MVARVGLASAQLYRRETEGGTAGDHKGPPRPYGRWWAFRWVDAYWGARFIGSRQILRI